MKRVYTGGTILTMGPEGAVEALLCENGRILEAGELASLRLQAGADREEIDLGGGTLLPGFIDAHSHFSQVAAGLLQVSLEGCAAVTEIQKRIAAFIEKGKLPVDSWVLCRDYDNNLFPGSRNLTLRELDALAPGYALLLQHKSGHMGLANSLALKKLNITRDTPAPAGGRIGVTEGEPNGYLEENAYFVYAKKTPMAGPGELLRAYGDAQALYASYGITTLQEGYCVKEMLPLYELLLHKDILKLDLVGYPDRETYTAFAKAFPNHVGKYEKHFKLGGLKIFLDGSPQGRTAWMKKSYLGEPAGYCGYGVMTDEAVAEALAFAGKQKLQVLTHCNGDAAAAQLLRCLEKAEAEYPVLKERRPVIIHAQLLGLDQLENAAKLGLFASFFIAHIYRWGDVHCKNFGLERAAAISPARSALKAGLPFTFHQDAPVILPDMLETLWCAVNRITKEGVLLGPEERLTPLEALGAVTSAAACQYFEEKEKGALRPGMAEDLVLLSRDPLTVPPEEIRSIRVLKTVKGGDTVFSR